MTTQDTSPADIQPDDDDTTHNVSTPEMDQERGFNDAELATCLRVLTLLGEKPDILNRREYRDLRRVGSVFIEGFNNKFFFGDKNANTYLIEKEKRQEINRRQRRKKDLDREKVNKVKMRTARTDYLNSLIEPPSAVPLLTAPSAEGEPKTEGEQQSSAIIEGLEGNQLHHPRSCYICKTWFYELHFFYDLLCPACASLSYEKRTRKVDLTGRVAILTGARIKIGYQAALRLLRNGATVHVTTRFPHDSALRYAQEKDFDEFSDRLHIHGLDLRDLRAVEQFCKNMCRTLHRLDILINNAAQTVRRPPMYYRHLLENELLPVAQLPAKARTVVRSNNQYNISKTPAITATDGELQGASLTQNLQTTSALLSQVSLLESDNASSADFPANEFDEHHQQIDKRNFHSWSMRMHEVPTVEVIETHAVNAIAPFILNKELKPLMLNIPEEDKFIVNVSAMEGKFYRHKTIFHPHTNMAKASLNMMTRTSADDYAKDRIYMTCVDTGWITDENPFDKAKEIAESGFKTPIDEIEAAARIIDPALSGYADGQKPYGKFFKDYAESEW